MEKDLQHLMASASETISSFPLFFYGILSFFSFMLKDEKYEETCPPLFTNQGHDLLSWSGQMDCLLPNGRNRKSSRQLDKYWYLYVSIYIHIYMYAYQAIQYQQIRYLFPRRA